MKKPVALIILDGWGYNPKTEGNAIENAKTPYFHELMKTCPHTLVSASGMDVGLPEGQMGNSEVGHLNIGAGRIIYQELTKITKMIRDGEFFKNEELLSAVAHAKETGGKLHLLGLLSDGGVHSHIDHVKALLKLAKDNGLNEVYVHAFMDGRDTPPKSGLGYIKELEASMKEIGIGRIATVSGRYYAMDRDKRWERTKLAYDALVHGEGAVEASAEAAVTKAYEADTTDEFILPTCVIQEGEKGFTGNIEAHDSIIFFNFRPDRARQLTRALVDEGFAGFSREHFKLKYVCMTQYDITMPNVSVAYKPQNVHNTLGEYLSANGKHQLRIAETEKYAHVTFFFNGGVEAPNPNEERLLIPSPQVATYDLQPEMSAKEVTSTLVKAIDSDQFDFIVLNFANPDMVGHTGVMSAAIKAVETVDACLKTVVEKLLSKGGKAIVTADHGNAEMMVDYETHEPMTAHTTNLVPCILVGDKRELVAGGKLCDLAPTLLELLEMQQPSEMEGRSLLKHQ